MPSSDPQFLFMTCRPGAENALKAEIARREPALHPAFSRPGFLTFKHTGDRPWDDRQLAARQWVFARTHGISLGRTTGTKLSQMADELWRQESVAQLLAAHRLADIHVWQRDAVPLDDRGSVSCTTPLAEEVERVVRQGAPEPCAALREMPSEWRATTRNGRVLDVVLVEPHEWWFGHHRAATPTGRWPGGVLPITMPEYAVSRAYAKMQEALAWSGLPLAAGDECVEIGCAPGGASQALLDRGLFVTGVDPADVDEAVLASPRFRHLRKRGHEVRRREFLGVRWLAVDVNIPPPVMLDTVQQIVTHPDVSIRGLILTLKFADWNEAQQLPEFAERVRGWGYRDVRMRQLATGGLEVCVAALRRRALRRLGRQRTAGSHRKSRRPSQPELPSPPAARLRPDAPHVLPEGPHF